MSYKSWITGIDDTITFLSWDNLMIVVNKEYQINDDLTSIRKKLGISFAEVYEAIGFKDEDDFNEDVE